MATIRKKGELQWHVQIRKKGFPTATKTFSLKTDAERWARQVESEMDKGMFVNRSEAEATILKDAFDRYLKEVSVTKKSYASESSMIHTWQSCSLASRSLASVRGVDVSAWRDARLKVVSSSTVHRELSILSHLFTVAAKDWGMGITNPVLLVRKPKPEKGRERRLEDGECELLLKECRKSSIELEAIAIVAIETAARLGELLKLEWSNVDLDRCTARFLDTKNGENRTIPLSSRAISVLRKLSLHESGRVFYRWKAADSFNKVWTRACARAGIEDLRFHDLRHEACSRMADKFQMHELMKITGHKSSAMLARYYHPRAEDLAKRLA
jgi:integrase